MLLLTVVSLVPLMLCMVVIPSEEPLVFPYLNDAYVDNPLALTVPFRVAELDVTFVADPVVTEGTLPVAGVGVGDGVGEGVGVVAADAERLPSSFETKTSPYGPSKEVSYAPLVVGKSVEEVYPVT